MRSALLLFPVALVVLAGCGDDTDVVPPVDASGDYTLLETGTGPDGATAPDTGGDDGGGADAPTESAPTNPPPPALGTQIDCMGRPGINTALTHPFDSNTTTQGAAKDAYNAQSNPTTWSSNVAPFAGALAVYDGLDTTCGNQPGFANPAGSGYTALATLLASDELWVNTAATTCQQYLGVELQALGAITAVDCGGRTPSENVMDLTYDILAGTITPATLPAAPGPVTNGITAPSAPPGPTFPYFAPPH